MKRFKRFFIKKSSQVLNKTSFKVRLVSLLANKRTFIGGLSLIAASVIANFLNFLYNAFLGRVLSFEDFALIGIFGGFLSFGSVLFSAFSTTANFRAGFLIGKYGNHAAFSFWKYMRRNAFLISFLIGGIWILMTPILMNYFHSNNPYIFIFFGIVLLINFANGVDRGFLSSRFMFGSLAAVNLLEPIIRMSAALLLVYLGIKAWAFSAVPIGMVCVFLFTWILVVKQIRPGIHKAPEKAIKKFSKKFFLATILTGASSVGFLTLDVLLAKHYLNPTEAGKYALLSLVGKMVYFLGGLISPFLVPLISRSEGAKKDSTHVLYIILLSTVILSLVGYLSFGLFGFVTIPILYGKKALTIVPYLSIFTLGMMAYTISRVFVSYYLIKRSYTFTALNVFLALLQITVISIYHASLGVIALDMVFVWFISLVLITLFHLGVNYVKAFENNIFAFLELFSEEKTVRGENLNILILNWRDTKHKWAGGAEVYVQELAKRWVTQGNSVTVFAGNGSKRPRNEKIDGVQIIRRGGFYTVYIWAAIYYLFKFHGKYNVIIDSENGIPFFTPLYTRRKKFLLIHHVHQEVFRKSLMWPFSSIAAFLEAKLMPFVYKNVQVITVSHSSKEEILRHKLTIKEPEIIHNGVNLSEFHPGKKSRNPLIVYIGRLQYYKSLNIFVKAAAKILKRVPNAEFVIAGEGVEKKKLMEYAEKLKIQNKIKFSGFISHQKKINLMQEAWVFVNPSFMEGWGITTIEAAACGTPTVASDVPGLRDSIKNNITGFLAKYGDSEAFADRIIRLIENKKLRKAMSYEAKEWAAYFSWDKSAKAFFNLINQRRVESKDKAFSFGRVYLLVNRITSLF